jgi:hypothetical protein
MVILSPTRIPPVSGAAFQFRPQSLRSILLLVLKSALTPGHGLLAWPLRTLSEFYPRQNNPLKQPKVRKEPAHS